MVHRFWGSKIGLGINGILNFVRLTQGQCEIATYLFNSGSVPCPDSNPFAFDAGNKCCSSHLDALDATRILLIYDSEDHCSQGDTISCPHLPSGRKCNNEQSKMFRHMHNFIQSMKKGSGSYDFSKTVGTVS